MTISKISTLVTAPWLRQQILPAAKKLSSNLRVLDSAWVASPDVDGYQFYQQEHIPTALHFDLNDVTPRKVESLHSKPIPEPKVFKQYVEELGISNNTHVVIYDGFGYRPSFRTWFLFRLFGHDKISVLNGGLGYWKSLGYPTTIEEPDVEPSAFEVNFRRHLLRDFESMKANVKSKSEQVMDSRGAQGFHGAEDGSGGHVPGAMNIPFDSLMNEDGLFKEGQELKDLFDKANIDLSRPLVAMCQTAMTACSITAAAHILGKEDVPVYNGSFTEWSQMADPHHIVKSSIEK